MWISLGSIVVSFHW